MRRRSGSSEFEIVGNVKDKGDEFVKRETLNGPVEEE